MPPIARMALLLVAISGQARSENSYLIVGGGPYPVDYDASIERNVVWLEDLVPRWNFSSGEIWYGLGADGKPDVLLQAADEPAISQWEPLARVFNEVVNNRLRLSHNQVRANAGPFTYDNVSAVLEQRVGALKRGDSLFFIYSGHGSRSREEAYEMNGLRLLGDKQYTAKSFSKVLQRAAEGSHVRFVLPQCFSGGFLRPVFRTPTQPTISTLMPDDCGFVSVPESRIAEGCTVGVQADEYRDYSTYFFAALAGRSRTGEALTTDPDSDHDGQVTLLEAHHYAFSEAESTDIPSSTSEYVLEMSQPWYSRWLPRLNKSPDNPYTRLAQRIATRIGVDSDDDWRLLSAGRTLSDKVEALAQAIKTTGEEARTLRLSLESRLAAISQVKYKTLSETVENTPSAEAQKAIDWIRSQADYPRLAALQVRVELLKQEHLE
ncbi:MAG: hypothetical protein P8178_04275, partial [Candidatus Thiodiazotropha sp.]